MTSLCNTISLIILPYPTKREKTHILATLLTQLDLVTKKIVKLGASDNDQNRYTPPHKHTKHNVNEDGQISDILLLILQKVKSHDKVLNDIKESVSIRTEITSFQFISILVEIQMGHMMTHIYPVYQD